EEVSSASTAPNGGSHGDIKLLNDGTNKVLWINIEGTWSNIGSLISSIVDHTHSSTSGQGGQLDWDDVFSDAVHSHASNAEGGTLDWDACWADAVHTHQSNAEGATLDHGAALTGLDGDDHTQYHNDTRGDARYYTETELDAGQLDNRYFAESEHLATSAGATDAGKPIKLDANGNIDATMINDADISHSGLTGTHNLTTDIDHDALTNYNANEHKDTTAWDANLIPDADNIRNLGVVGVTDYRWKDLKLSGNLDDETNQISVAQCKTAYDFVAPSIIAFSAGDTTPSISGGYVFSVPQVVSITNFDNPPVSGTKIIEVISSVNGVIIIHDITKIKLSGGIDAVLNTDDCIEFRWDGTKWVERNRILF
ncbi:MAG: hypothetical protein KJ725_20590, partial [Gammaproteobacteria bacterium]|nr:hypothetical protein [Gammaproteobacteria bacterium]